MSVFFQEFTTLNGTIQPFLSFFHLVVKHGEHPYLTSLQPDELIRIENLPFTVQAAEITAKLNILRVLEPEWKDIVQQFIPVLIR